MIVINPLNFPNFYNLGNKANISFFSKTIDGFGSKAVNDRIFLDCLAPELFMFFPIVTISL